MKLSSLLKWGFGVILLLGLAGIFLSNYSSGIYLGTGMAILMIIGILVYVTGWKITILFLSGISLATFLYFKNRVTVAIAPVIIAASVICTQGTTITELELTNYTAEIEPVDFSKGSFRVTEHVTYNRLERDCSKNRTEVVKFDANQDLPARNIQSSVNGLFIHEVSIPVELKGFKNCPNKVEIGYPKHQPLPLE